MKLNTLRRALNSALAVAVALVCAFGPASAEVEKYPGGPIVAELVSRLLEQTHYAKKPIDAAVSKQFLDNYLESYDYNHMILNKSDADEFETKYAATLGDLVKDGNVDPAYEIYDRVEKRLEERVAPRRLVQCRAGLEGEDLERVAMNAVARRRIRRQPA